MTFMDLRDDTKSKRKGKDKGGSKSVLDLQTSGSPTLKRLLDASALAGFDQRAAKVKGKEKSGFFRTPTYQRIRKTLAAYTSKQESKPQRWRTTTVATLDKLIEDFTSKRQNIKDQKTSDGRARWEAVWFLRPKVKAELKALLAGGGEVGGAKSISTDVEEEAELDQSEGGAEPQVVDAPEAEEEGFDDALEEVDDEPLIGQEEAEEVAEEVAEDAPEVEDEDEKVDDEQVDEVVDEVVEDEPVEHGPEEEPVQYGPEEEPVQYGPEEEPVEYGPQTQMAAKWDEDPEAGFVPKRSHEEGEGSHAPFWEAEGFEWSEEKQPSHESSVGSATVSSSQTKSSQTKQSAVSMTAGTAKRVKERKLTSSQHSGSESLADVRRRRALFVAMRKEKCFSSQFDSSASGLDEARKRRTEMYKEAGKAVTQARAKKRAGDERTRLREKYGNLESWGDLDPIERAKRQLVWDIAHEETKESSEFKWALKLERGQSYRQEFTEGSAQLSEFYWAVAFGGKKQEPDGKWVWTSKHTPGAVPLQTHEERAEYAMTQTTARWTLPFIKKYWDKLTVLANKGAWPKEPPKLKEDGSPESVSEQSQQSLSQQTQSQSQSQQSEKTPEESSAKAASDEKVAVEQVEKEDREKYRLGFSGGKITQGPSREALDTGKMATNASGAGFGIYVMSVTGVLYVGTHQAGLFHHSSFLKGSAVAAAGEMKVSGGKLQLLTNKSGHYLPQEEHLLQAILELRSQGVKPSTYDIRAHNKNGTKKEGVNGAEFLDLWQSSVQGPNRDRSKKIKQ